MKIADLMPLPRWTAWQTEKRSDRKNPTKVPYRAVGKEARSNDSRTWLTHEEASALSVGLPKPMGSGGIGLWLGPLDGIWQGLALGGVDYDTCIGAAGIEDWALTGMAAIGSYCEVSPSGGGLKQFFLHRTAAEGEQDEIRRTLGIRADNTGRKWSPGGPDAHPPGIETYLGRRFFALTGDEITGFGAPGELREIDAAAATGLLTAAGLLTGQSAAFLTRSTALQPVRLSERDRTRVPGGEAAAQACGRSDAFRRLWTEGDLSVLAGNDKSRSAVAFFMCGHLRAIGCAEDEAHELIGLHPCTASWIAETDACSLTGRGWERAWSRAPSPPGAGLDVLPIVPGLSSDLPAPDGAMAFGAGLRGVGREAADDTDAREDGCDDGLQPRPERDAEPILDESMTDRTGKPVIQVRAGQTAEMVDQAEQVLTSAGIAVYTRGARLTAPASREVRVRGGNKATVAGLHAMGQASMIDCLSRTIAWMKWNQRKKGGAGFEACDPPTAVVAVMLERIGRRPFHEVSGISATPGLTPDGNISEVIGYDPVLNIHRVRDRWLRMPAGWNDRPPVRRDAEDGLALLMGLLVGFPFVDACDRSIAVALILTCMCRSAVPLAPVFAVTATAAGTGKSHLIDLASVIATGQRCPAAGAGHTEEETDKRLGGLIAAGYPLVSLDNVNGTLRSNLLGQAVERERLLIRLLGSSEAHEIECRTVFAVNGNGLTLSGDLPRRTCPCRLDAGVERPENRAFDFDPVKLAEANRGPYVAAALTILRAHAEAGYPGATGLKPLVSYDEWTRHVRGSLVWLGMEDPIVAMDKARAEDPDIATLQSLLQAWLRRFGSKEAYSVADAVRLSQQAGGLSAIEANGDPVAASANDLEDLREAFARVAEDRGAINTKKLGNWIGRHAGRVHAGLRFAKGKDSHNTARWRVERASPDIRVVK